MRIAVPTAALFLLVSPLALGAQVYPEYSVPFLSIENWSQYRLWIWTESPDGRSRLAVEQIEPRIAIDRPSGMIDVARLILDDNTRVCMEAWVANSRVICWDIYATQGGAAQLLVVDDADFLGEIFAPFPPPEPRPQPEPRPDIEAADWYDRCGNRGNQYRGLLRVIHFSEGAGFESCFEEPCQWQYDYYRGAEDVPAGYWTAIGKTWYIWKEFRPGNWDRWQSCEP